MATSKVSETITQFREDVLSRGGPQISGMYEVVLAQGNGTPIVCYPMNVVLPGRLFITYDHDIWGTIRKVPYKRGYTQCSMSFIVYQDWAERTYIESWMNTIIRNDSRTVEQQIALDTQQNSTSEPTVPQLTGQQFNTITQSLSSGGVQDKNANFGNSKFNDYVDYYGGIGTVVINCLNSQTKQPNRTVVLREAYPATISPLTLASDGSGYPTFTVSFQYKDYIYI
jgi:hypothetical protein